METSKTAIEELLSDYAMRAKQYSASVKAVPANSNNSNKPNNSQPASSNPSAYRQSETRKLESMSPEDVVAHKIERARNEIIYHTERTPEPVISHTKYESLPSTEPKTARKERAPALSYVNRGLTVVNEQVSKISNLPPRYLAGMFALVVATSAGFTAVISGLSSKAEASTMHANPTLEEKVKENEEPAQRIDKPSPTPEEISLSEAEIRKRIKMFYEPLQGDELAVRCYSSPKYPVPASQPAAASQPALVEVARNINGTKIYSPFGAKPFRMVSGFDAKTTAASFITSNASNIVCENPSGEEGDDKVICYRKHNAVDLALIDRLNDTIVYPVTEGRVVKIVKGPRCAGNYAEVEHPLTDGKKMRVAYVHIKQFSPELEEHFRRTGARNIAIFRNNDGPIVKPYTARENGIGIIGGLFGMHLHVEASIDGQVVDPAQYLPQATPHQFSTGRMSASIPYDTKYRDALTHISRVLGLAPGIMQSIRKVEAGDMKAVSVANCRGFMQIKESTANKLAKVCANMPEVSDFCNEISWGAVTNDPWVNILAGTVLFRSDLNHAGGSYLKAVAAYNAGIGSVFYAVKKSQRTGLHFIGHMPSNIPQYVNAVFGTTVYARPKPADPVVPTSQPASQPAAKAIAAPASAPAPKAHTAGKPAERKPIPAVMPPASAPAPAITAPKTPPVAQDEDDEENPNARSKQMI